MYHGTQKAYKTAEALLATVSQGNKRQYTPYSLLVIALLDTLHTDVPLMA
jgi:hypothetical protein